MPHSFSNAYTSGTECPIDLKPGCKFKFLRCLEDYLRKLIKSDHEGALEGPFFTKGPLKIASLGPFWGLFGGP